MRYRLKVKRKMIKTYEQWEKSLVPRKDTMCSKERPGRPCRRKDEHRGLCTWEGRPVFETDPKCPTCDRHVILLDRHIAFHRGS
jgi:hypothetical protein